VKLPDSDRNITDSDMGEAAGGPSETLGLAAGEERGGKRGEGGVGRLVQGRGYQGEGLVGEGGT
jgi:hypothetical protein